MENLFEQHIERMKKLQSVYEPHTGQHNILGMLINECKQALHKHRVSGKRPTTQGIRAVATRYSHNNPTHNEAIMPHDLRDAFISGVEWFKSFTAACASGGVDTVAEGEELLCFCANGGEERADGTCAFCSNKIARKSSEEQP